MKSSAIRFSLAAMMASVAGAGFRFSPPRAPSSWGASAAFPLSFGGLLFAVPAAGLCRHAARAFWFGFLWFGWAYMCLVFGPWFSSNVKDHLLTSRALGFLYDQMKQGANSDSAWLDLYVTGSPNRLFRNVGGGRFVD